jgi:hypothetical protein
MDKHLIWQLILSIALLFCSGLLFYVARKIK